MRGCQRYRGDTCGQSGSSRDRWGIKGDDGHGDDIKAVRGQ